jgi:hypothetical protein
MRTTIVGFLLAALCSPPAPGQSTSSASQERVLRFVHTQTTQSAQEIATAIRVIADLNQDQVSSSKAPESLTIRATGEPMALAEWLFVSLDQPDYPPADPATREYKLSAAADNVVWVHHLTHTATVQRFQEEITAVRTIFEIRRVATHNAQRAVVMRGTAGQIAAAEWLFGQMDKPENQPARHAVSPEYLMQDPRDEGVTRVFFVANAATVQDFQELATLMRTIADVRRVFTCNGPRAIAARGTADQIAMVEWLFDQLDSPSAPAGQGGGSPAATHEYRASGSRDDLVRVLYLTHTHTVQDFQKAATQIRVATNISKVFTYNTPRALALRGTVNQIKLAERIAGELDKP